MTISVFAWPKDRNREENPYNYLVYRDMPNDVVVTEFNYRTYDIKNADILHVHWPDRLLDDKRRWRLMWRFNRFLWAVNKLRRRGGKLVWTVHNLQSREVQYKQLAERYLKRFIEKVDGFVFLSEVSKQLFFQLHGEFPHACSAVIPHPHYRDVYSYLTVREARKKLSIPDGEFILGFFGKIRRNKGIDLLVKSFEDSDVQGVRLLLAGAQDKRGMSPALDQHLKNKDTLNFIRFIEPDEVGPIIGSCNVLIFPYHDILNSGSSILALSLGKPIIAPRIGSFVELQEKIGNDWIYLYEQPLTSEKLLQALNWAKSLSKGDVRPDLNYADPLRVAKLTSDFYKQLMAAT